MKVAEPPAGISWKEGETSSWKSATPASSPSSTIVTVARPRAITAFPGFESSTKKVSFGSGRVSPLTVSVTVFFFSPGANVSVSVAGS